MVAASAAALLRSNGTDAEIAARPALRTPERIWTHGEVYAEACRYATLFRERLPADRPPHVGVLLDNIPEYLFAFGGAALIGATVVGLNHTRRGEHLLRDIHHTDVGLVVTEPAHEADLDPIRSDLGLPAENVLRRRPRRSKRPCPPTPTTSAIEPDLDTLWALIFTSGTSRRAQGGHLHASAASSSPATACGMIMDLGPDDVGYVCMPLFHSNAVMVGWAPSIVAGASVGLARRFTASGWLPDVRRYGATYFNYTGKPLAYLSRTPEQPDDADNPLRVAFGNEGSPEVVDGFARRFGVEVIDAFGATEGGVAVNRDGRRAGRARSGGAGATVQGRRRGRRRAAAWPASTPTAGCSTPRSASARSSTPPAPARSRATTTTTRRTSGPRATAGTGPATSATSTTTATSTSPAATPTGSGSTARTSRPGRSRTRSAAPRRRASPRSTACPTSRPATR